MTGERDLRLLLSCMEPELSDEEFVFCCVPGERAAGPELHAICRFKEREGVSLIVRRSEAERYGIPFNYPCKLITLTVHSSLDAVGFLARITAELAGRGISANVVSAYHHDYVFVPVGCAEEALHILRGLQAAEQPVRDIASTSPSIPR